MWWRFTSVDGSFFPRSLANREQLLHSSSHPKDIYPRTPSSACLHCKMMPTKALNKPLHLWYLHLRSEGLQISMVVIDFRLLFIIPRTFLLKSVLMTHSKLAKDKDFCSKTIWLLLQLTAYPFPPVVHHLHWSRGLCSVAAVLTVITGPQRRAAEECFQDTTAPFTVVFLTTSWRVFWTLFGCMSNS